MESYLLIRNWHPLFTALLVGAIATLAVMGQACPFPLADTNIKEEHVRNVQRKIGN